MIRRVSAKVIHAFLWAHSSKSLSTSRETVCVVCSGLALQAPHRALRSRLLGCASALLPSTRNNRPLAPDSGPRFPCATLDEWVCCRGGTLACTIHVQMCMFRKCMYDTRADACDAPVRHTCADVCAARVYHTCTDVCVTYVLRMKKKGSMLVARC